jgi:D-serine deaminase-like pyridoxal phosphate-dependent protein
LLIDLDVGMGRSGIAPGEAAAQLYRHISRLAHVAPGGLHAYDGQIHDRDVAAREEVCAAAMRPVGTLRDQLIAEGLLVPRIVAGGTPTFPFHARHADRECGPGTCVLWDAGYAAMFPDLDFLPAAVVLSRVISKPGRDRLCLDLGHKAVAADPPGERVAWPELPDAKTVMHNEEHLTIATQDAQRYQVGDVLYGIPWHICPTCALHKAAILVRDRRAMEAWSVDARDRD